MLYMDYAATTPPYDEVVDTMAEVMKRHFGNPSSLHRLGADAEMLVTRARETIAGTLGVSPSEIVFTSGGTESNNLAVQGAVRRFASRGNHLITTEVEHAAVYETFRMLERQGFKVTYLPVDRSGVVRLDQLREALNDETIMVSVMFVNNEVGAVQPIGAIGAMLRQYPKALFHVDAVQAYGKIPIQPRTLGIDLMSVSAHKFRGPKGAGFMYRRQGLELAPVIAGGGQENGLRSGTENVAALVGMAKAARMAAASQEAFERRVREVRNAIVSGIRHIPGLVLNGPDSEAEAAAHIVHFSLPGIRPEVMVHALEQHGIYISTRSACSSDETEPSRVLLAMGADPDRAASGLRVSLGLEHSLQDGETFVQALRTEAAKHERTQQTRNRRLQ